MFGGFFHKIKQDSAYQKKYPPADLEHSPVISYDAYWKKKRKGGDSWLSDWQKERLDIVAKMIDPGSSVMDIGCGDGLALEYLKSRVSISAVGVDISDDILAKAKERGIDAIKMDLNDLDAAADLPEVDYLVGMEILEHMPNPEALIQKIRPKVRKGMIFTFPNSAYYPYRLRLLFGGFPLQFINHPGEHLRFWTGRDLKLWWVKALGADLEALVIHEGLPILNKIWPNLFGQGIIIKLSFPSKPGQ